MVGFAPPAGNADAAYRYFLARGWTPAQAAGIVGNLQQESGPGLDPTIVGDSGNAFGIAQWNDRRNALHGWAQSGGMDPAALQTQLDFISHELDTTEGRAAAALRGAQTPEEAARAFLGFERPQGFSWADPTGSHGYQNRVANALRLYGGGTMPQPMSSMPAPGPAAGGQSMAGGGLLGVQPPALRQSWLGGLLGVEPSADQGILGSFLNPQGSADRLGLLGLAANLLQASGPSTDPSHGSFGSALGAGLQGYVAGSEAGAKRDERDRLNKAREQLLQLASGMSPEMAAVAAAYPEAFAQGIAGQAFDPPQTRTINRGDQEVTQQYDAQTRGWVDVGTAPRWNPATGQDQTPFQAFGTTGVLDTRTGQVAPVDGAGDGMFQGNALDAQALNWAVQNGRMTRDQANDWALGHQVTDNQGHYYWVTPTMVYGSGPQATAPMPDMGGGTMPASASPAGAASAAGGTPQPFLTVDPKMTTDQANAAMYADRMFESAGIIKQFADSGTELGQRLLASAPFGIGNMLVSPEYQQLEQAQRDFINALLRRESGAVINDQEFENARKQYFPQPGDTPEVLAQKQRNMDTALAGMARGAGVAYVPPAARGQPGSASAATPAAPLPPPTGATLNTTPAATAPGSYPRPTTAAERDALAPGTVYQAPDGTLRTRP